MLHVSLQWHQLDASSTLPFSRFVDSPSNNTVLSTRFDDYLNVYWRNPAFLESVSYVNPADINYGPFQFANNMPHTSLYDYFAENTGMAARFGGMVQMYNTGKPFFWEDGYYPFKERLIDNGPKDENEVLLVDIGGGDGHDLGKLRRAFGEEMKGRLILQELAHHVESSTQDGFEAQVGDWNVVQPIEGTYIAFVPRSSAST